MQLSWCDRLRANMWKGKRKIDMEIEKMLKSNTGTHNYVDWQLSSH